ncbi:hypothetical protein CCUS01_04055 [Colletotrichum cuscutae]|uniref:Uncharacterized protein n=1 Tax=Colletotrichum cuscutae TaxID=1209917 RepID=A0AAI9VEE3_9PEZI|nr:hypothetical protein CCUS01_04055 [Colletotrichum cuscutae]
MSRSSKKVDLRRLGSRPLSFRRRRCPVLHQAANCGRHTVVRVHTDVFNGYRHT